MSFRDLLASFGDLLVSFRDLLVSFGVLLVSFGLLLVSFRDLLVNSSFSREFLPFTRFFAKCHHPVSISSKVQSHLS
ncbi:hypothetical protein KEH51_28270 [[Brevibacterium] frigoritolerans]|uniref:Uncharacterized protein n=1 Tax=Peribacillus frigoritolerans TaxID=450367 RepID=A0A941FKD2_9BACI|nr:hypothetical protein [Peribacillus frigoritolerans]